MKKPPRTERRGGQWYYRRRVPLDLVEALGFSEFRESLKTSDMDTAGTRAVLRDVEVTVELQAARQQLKTQQAKAERDRPAAVETLSPEALRYIREAVRAHALKSDEGVRVARPDEDSLFHHESELGEQYAAGRAALASGEVAPRGVEQERVLEALQAVGVDILPGAPSWPEAAYRATEGNMLALEDIRERMAGKPSPTPDAPRLPPELMRRQGPAGSDVVTLAVVVQRLKLERKPATATMVNFNRAVKAIGAITGEACPVADITREC